MNTTGDYNCCPDHCNRWSQSFLFQSHDDIVQLRSIGRLILPTVENEIVNDRGTVSRGWQALTAFQECVDGCRIDESFVGLIVLRFFPIGEHFPQDDPEAPDIALKLDFAIPTSGQPSGAVLKLTSTTELKQHQHSFSI